MKLYEIKLPAKVFCEGISDGSDYITVDHLDGMYSYGVTEKGGVIHLSVSTPLEKKGKDYQVKEEI